MLYIFSHRVAPSILSKNEIFLQILNVLSKYQHLPLLLKNTLRIFNWVVQTIPLHKELRESLIASIDSILLTSKELKIHQITLRSIYLSLKNTPFIPLVAHQ